MRRLAGLLCCFAFMAACEYRETVGREPEPSIASPDASPGCIGSDCAVDCSNFTRPGGDCSLDHESCSFDSDCTGLNESCNRATRRCFAADDTCVGTLCNTNSDCPASERCNRTANSCYRFAEDQTCMPCFLLSEDCGGQSCDHDLDICT